MTAIRLLSARWNLISLSNAHEYLHWGFRFFLFLPALAGHRYFSDQKRTLVAFADFCILIIYDGMLAFSSTAVIGSMSWRWTMIGFFLLAGAVLTWDLFAKRRLYFCKGMDIRQDAITYDAVAKDLYRVLRDVERSPAQLIFWPYGWLALQAPDEPLEKAINTVFLEVSAAKQARWYFHLMMKWTLLCPALIWLLPLMSYIYNSL